MEVTHTILNLGSILPSDMAPHCTENQLGTADTLGIVVYQKEIGDFLHWLLIAGSGVVVCKDIVLMVARNPEHFFVALA